MKCQCRPSSLESRDRYSCLNKKTLHITQRDIRTTLSGSTLREAAGEQANRTDFLKQNLPSVGSSQRPYVLINIRRTSARTVPLIIYTFPRQRSPVDHTNNFSSLPLTLPPSLLSLPVAPTARNTEKRWLSRVARKSRSLRDHHERLKDVTYVPRVV